MSMVVVGSTIGGVFHCRAINGITAIQADATPVGTLLVNGVAHAATVVVVLDTSVAVAPCYRWALVVPNVAAGSTLAVSVVATLSSVSANPMVGNVWEGTVSVAVGGGSAPTVGEVAAGVWSAGTRTLTSFGVGGPPVVFASPFAADLGLTLHKGGSYVGIPLGLSVKGVDAPTIVGAAQKKFRVRDLTKGVRVLDLNFAATQVASTEVAVSIPVTAEQSGLLEVQGKYLWQCQFGPTLADLRPLVEGAVGVRNFA